MKKSLLLFPLLLLAAACSEQPAGPKANDMPRFDDADLSIGRSIWVGICRNCHLLGVASAPAVTNYPAWSPRIAKGKSAL